MKTSIVLGLFLLLLLGCDQKKKSDTLAFPDAPDSTTSVDAAIVAKLNQADEAYSAMRRINMIHTHGKDLAVNAHQDIPRKRRMMRRARELAPKKRLAYKKAQQRKKEALERQRRLDEKTKNLED